MEDSHQDKIKIIINDGREILARQGISLLQALKNENIFVPSACGGRGICGLCRLQIMEGAPENLTARELAHLNTDEQAENFRLACQIQIHQASGMVDRNLRIVIPNSFFNAREFRATVAETRDLTGDIKELRLELSNPKSISFKSGQYIQLRIPPYAEHKRIIYRAYSIASPPSENSFIELEIRCVKTGIGTTYIFEHLKKGDPVVFNGPHGNFFLQDNDKPVVMIAGGSGMAPMKSMLSYMRDHKLARPTRYFFGAQSPFDVFYADLMRSFERSLPDFRFIPAVSAVNPGEKWQGETGRIDEVVAHHLKEDFPGEVYLCGSPAMINSCLELLKQKNITEDRIFYDKFA